MNDLSRQLSEDHPNTTRRSFLAKIPSSAAGLTAVGLLAKSITTAEAAVSSPSSTLYINVKDFEAKGDGITDDTASIQAAIEFASKSTTSLPQGGTIFIPAGKYLISKQLNVNASGVHLLGAGSYNTEILCTNSTQHGIVFGDGSNDRTHVGVSHLALNTIAPKTAGAAIWTQKVMWTTINNLRIANHFNAIQLTSSVLCLVNSIEVLNVPDNGNGIIIDGTPPSNDHYLREILVSAAINTKTATGFRILSSGGSWLENCSSLGCIGLVLIPPSGSTVEHLFCSRNAWDSGPSHGILISPLSGGTVRRCTFTGDWAATNKGNGVTLTGAGTITGMQFMGFRALNNQRHGFSLGRGTNILIEGSTCAGNGGETLNTYDGISVGNISGFRLIGNRCGGADGFANIQRYGISLNSGASANFIISLNDCQTNATGGILNLGITPSVVINNLT